MNFLDMLRRSKDQTSSEELRAAISEIDVAAAKNSLTQLELEYRRLLLSAKEAAVEECERKIALANREVVRMSAAVEELNTRATEAEVREHSDHLEKIANSARAAQKRAAVAISEIDTHAFALAEALRAHATAVEEIRSSNSTVLEAGRRDLEVKHPMRALTELIGHEGGPQLQHFMLPGYLPRLHPEGRLLGRIKELKF